MILAFSLDDLPGEAITVLLLLLFSFIGWLKDKIFAKRIEEPEPFEDEEMREVIWRRQMGEDARMPWEPEEQPVPTIRFDPPAPPKPAAPPPVPVRPEPPRAPVVRELSRKEEELANAFERAAGGSRLRRSHHRRQVDRLLRSPSAAKDAILLTEILSPPAGLKGSRRAEI